MSAPDTRREQDDEHDEGEQPLGLWIRVSAALADDADVRAFARTIIAPPVRNGATPTSSALTAPTWLAVLAAEGLLVNLWGKVAEHVPDGRIADVDDDQLEEWARWRGETGTFASAYRARFASDGVIKRWQEYQGKLLEYRKRERDRWQQRREAVNEARRKRYEEQQAEREKSRTRGRTGGANGVAPAVAPACAPPPDGNGNGNIQSAAATAAEPSSFPHSAGGGVQNSDSPEVSSAEPIRAGKTDSERALELTVALNSGLLDNPAVGESANPALPYLATALQAAETLAAEGVAHAWAVRAMYQVGKSYKPERPGQSISSISYGVNRLTRGWQQHLARIAAATAQRPAEAANDGAGVSTAGAALNGGNARQNGNGRRDLKGEGLIVFGRLRDSVRSVTVHNDPTDPGQGNRLEQRIRAEVLETLDEPGRAALAAIGGERKLCYPGSTDVEQLGWKFAAAYAAAAGAS
jgi:hypothetical protein